MLNPLSNVAESPFYVGGSVGFVGLLDLFYFRKKKGRVSVSPRHKPEGGGIGSSIRFAASGVISLGEVWYAARKLTGPRRVAVLWMEDRVIGVRKDIV